MADENVVVDRLRRIHGYTEDLEDMRDVSKAHYVEDVVLQRAVERTFMNLIQACIDLAQHIRAEEGLSPGGTGKEEVEALENAGIITSETGEKIEEAVGFRNVLAHRYGDINHEVVYEVLQTDLVWFERFQRDVARWFRDENQ